MCERCGMCESLANLGRLWTPFGNLGTLIQRPVGLPACAADALSAFTSTRLLSASTCGGRLNATA